MPNHRISLSLLTATIALSGFFALAQTAKRRAATPAPHKPTPVEPTGPTALIDTTHGRLTCRLYEKEAPELTTNFIALATGAQDWNAPYTGAVQHNKPFFDATALFGATDAIAGGDRLGGGYGAAGDPLPVAPSKTLIFDRPGRLAMSIREGKVSRLFFFITTHADSEMDAGPAPGSNPRGAIFGQCDDASIQTAAAISHQLLTTDNHPQTPIAINKI